MKGKGIVSLVKENVQSLYPYEVTEYPCSVKLDANESPYSPFTPRYLASNIEKILQRMNRYPDPDAGELKGVVSSMFRVRMENILHGNGSDELIYYLITTFGGPIMYPVPTFSMYSIIAQALGEERIEIPLNRDFDLDIDRILKVIKRYRPKLIFLSSPNNPTGNCFSSDGILRIIESTSRFSLVVIDEAYQPFANKRSFISHIRRHKNVAILRTLSKIGLAGLRVGFMIADIEIVRQVNKVRLPFNLNSFSQAMAEIVLRDKGMVQKNIKAIISERKRLFSEMSNITGIHPYPSDANFILFKVKNPDNVFNGLIKKGILIRNMKGSVNGCLRVTIGTPKENTIFLNALKELSGAQNKRRT